MQNRTACLLANHGAVVAGETLDRALWRMEELETLARGYILSMSTGSPTILTDEQMDAVVLAFGDYGPRVAR
jgi:L-fuculose-phosphate aldolase